MNFQETYIQPDQVGMRLDRYLMVRFPALSRGIVQRLIRKGQVRVNSSRARADHRLDFGDKIRLPPSLLEAEADLRNHQKNDSSRYAQVWPGAWEKRIIFEDDELLVFNKPAGLAVQGGTGLRRSLDQMIRVRNTSARLTHRIDRETSGAIVVAKTRKAAQDLTAAFQQKQIGKQYLAVLARSPPGQPGQTGVIRAKLSPVGGRMQIRTNEDSENSQMDREERTQGGGEEDGEVETRWNLLARGNHGTALVVCQTIGGKKHQVRAHLASISCPLLGDRLYGDDESLRLSIELLTDHGLPKMRSFLHAWTLTLPKFGRFVAEAPEDLQLVVLMLKLEHPDIDIGKNEMHID